MALLSDSDRQICARAWIEHLFVQAGATANMSYADIKAAADATDIWVDTNQSAFNLALPLPFQTTATLAQKSALMAYVTLKRGGIL